MVTGWLILTTLELLAKYGYYGLFVGAFLSAMFIPLGADILFVGMLAAGMNPWLCLLIATSGSWVGGLVIYSIGHAGNPERIYKLFRIRESQLEKQKIRIEKYGSIMALFVWIPIIGDISNVALGFYRTEKTKTFILMFIGRMFRFLLWIILYMLYNNRFVSFIEKI